MTPLRIGVLAGLLALPPHGGHGKVWHRVLAELGATERLVALDAGGRPRTRWARWAPPGVVLADGHSDLPPSRVPVVAEVHEAGWFTAELAGAIDPGFLAHIAPRTERALRRAAHVLTLSESSRGDLVAHYGLDPARVHAVHPGIDPLFLAPPPGGRELVAGRNGGREAPYVLYAASLHPRKNLGALRRAFAAIAASHPAHVLVVAGSAAPDRGDSAALRDAAAAPLPGAPGRLVFVPDPSDAEMAALMAGADVFCLPSLYEGFGLTALEAMASGTAVVVSDRGALPEVVGDAGLVVSPTPEALADAIGRLLADPARRAELGARANARARDFTWQATARGWLAVLRQAAEEGA